MEIKKWKKSHFCAYTLLCMAHSDNEMSAGELSSIKAYLNRLYPNCSDSLDEVFPVFLSHPEGLRTNFIKTKWKLFYKTEEEIRIILDEIEEMILVDGEINISEIKAYGSIRKAFGISDYD